MKRSGKIVLGVVGALALLGVVAVILVATFDWNRAKPWVAETVGHAIGRSIAIDGDLRVSWQRDPELRGWRAWMPGPLVTASKVTVDNTDWAKQREFATVESVEFDLAVFPLLVHTVSIPSLRFVAPYANLERLADGRDNWTFTANDTAAPSQWKFDLGRILFDRGQFSLSDHLRGTELKAHVDALEKSIPFDDLVVQQEDASRREAAARVGASGAKRFRERAQKRAQPVQHSGELPQQYAFSWSAQGTFHGAALQGTGRIGSVLALKHAERPFPLQADVRIGETRITLIGTLTDPADLDALDLRLWLSGSNLSQLYDILHIPLPDSRPYVTEGHLIGRFAADEKKLRYETFTARVGESDLSGDLVYETRKPRPLLSGKVQSERLQFRDLALMIGADTSESKSVRGDASPQPTGKVLPTKPFRPERWRVMDADVQFTGDRVFRDSELPIHKVDARIVMDDAVLSLKPLRFRYAYGDVEAALRFDGQNAPIKSTLQLSARGMQLKYLFPSAEAMKTSLGEANGEANLSATGGSIGALLGAANGEVKLLMDSGTISKALIETAGLNLPNIIVTKLFGDKQVRINCAASDFVATEGVYNAQLFVIDTDISRMDVSGNVNLGTEQLDLTVHPDSKSLRLLSLRSPIHVRGTFSQPDVSIDKGALLRRGAIAIGLGLVATPVAALLALTATSRNEGENRCEALLKEVQQAPMARKPAKKS